MRGCCRFSPDTELEDISKAQGSLEPKERGVHGLKTGLSTEIEFLQCILGKPV